MEEVAEPVISKVPLAYQQGFFSACIESFLDSGLYENEFYQPDATLGFRIVYNQHCYYGNIRITLLIDDKLIETTFTQNEHGDCLVDNEHEIFATYQVFFAELNSIRHWLAGKFILVQIFPAMFKAKGYFGLFRYIHLPTIDVKSLLKPYMICNGRKYSEVFSIGRKEITIMAHDYYTAESTDEDFAERKYTIQFKLIVPTEFTFLQLAKMIDNSPSVLRLPYPKRQKVVEFIWRTDDSKSWPLCDDCASHPISEYFLNNTLACIYCSLGDFDYEDFLGPNLV
jgi:hypothetical protein